MPGFNELLLLLVILVLIFGATKLPKLGASIGRTVKNFKQASAGKEEIEVSRVNRDGELSEGAKDKE